MTGEQPRQQTKVLYREEDSDDSNSDYDYSRTFTESNDEDTQDYSPSG